MIMIYYSPSDYGGDVKIASIEPCRLMQVGIVCFKFPFGKSSPTNFMLTKSCKTLIVLSLILSCAFAVRAQNAVSYLTEPAFSPDGSEIAFVSGNDIWTVPARGGNASLLVSHPANESRPMYSPDGKKLAFISTRTGGGDIYTLDFATGNLTRITFDDVPDQLEAWSRDGKYLYFSSTSRDISGMCDIFRVKSTGGTPMQFSADRYTNEFHAAPAPNNVDVAFVARGIGNSQWWRNGRSHIDESEIWLKRNGNYEKIASGGAKQLWVMWSANGKTLYYVSDRSGIQNIWSQPVNGQAKQLTDFKDGRVLWANISYDGRGIVFERDARIWTMNTENGKSNVVNINLRGVAASQIVDRANVSGQIRELALSPDGKKVALVARGEVFAANSKEGGDAVRITKTAAPESFVIWHPNSQKVVYSSSRGTGETGENALFQYDFATQTETRLTNGKNNDAAAIFSQDGKSLAFVRNARQLVVYDFERKQEREISKMYADATPLLGNRGIAWSPDNRYVAFLTYAPETRSYTNVHVASADGSDKNARAVTFIANSNANSISWSPDGTFLLFDTNQRTENGNLARVDLILRAPKFREDSFRDLFKQENPKEKTTAPGVAPTPQSSPVPSPTPQTTPTASPTPQTVQTQPLTPSQLIASDVKADDKSVKKDAAKTEIVFENIRQRLSVLQTGVDVTAQTISPDGKSVLILASAGNQFNLYILPLDELAADSTARQLTSTASPKSDAQFSPDGKEVYFLENGRVNIVGVDKREVRPLALNVETTVNFANEKLEVFNEGWRYMRDHFYDEKFHGSDWNVVRARYEPLINGAKTMDETRRLMNLMVGELNSSHLGVGAPSVPIQQTTQVGKLGIRFDSDEYDKNGSLKITEIIDLSPTAIVKNIKVGDYLIGIDGVSIKPQMNVDELLENKSNRRVEIVVAGSPDGAANKREIVVKPISTGLEKFLLYRQWVESNRRYVEQISDGKFGYVHLPDMSSNSLDQLSIDLDAQNQSKQAVVVDIRNNNGGFINPYVIDVLSRRGYLTMKERGLWSVPARSALGQRALERPTILITNQHSLSDAEDLTEGYRSLKLGKVVGEPTAGWIIFTWNATLFDGTSFRLPRAMITGNDGKDMELNPRAVDIAVTRPIGETILNKDSQLDAAVRELESEIK